MRKVVGVLAVAVALVLSMACRKGGGSGSGGGDLEVAGQAAFAAVREAYAANEGVESLVAEKYLSSGYVFFTVRLKDGREKRTCLNVRKDGEQWRVSDLAFDCASVEALSKNLEVYVFPE